MRLSPVAVATVGLFLGLARPNVVAAGPAGDLLIPFAADVDIDPLAQYVAPSFLDTSQCERFAVFISGSVTGLLNPSNIKPSLRFGIPDGGTIVRAGAWTPTAGSSLSDESGVMFVWQQTFEIIAPRMQPVLMNTHPSASAHINKAWLYCKTTRRR